VKRISPAARREIDRSKELLISAASVLELELLHEIGRIRIRSAAITGSLYKELGIRVCPVSFDKIAFEAADIKWTASRSIA
jgi:PIN domain nuclease of toxin-antitoxin system